MKYSQNERILQITEETLIVGVDVGSQTHYARAFDFRGIELGKLIKFSNDMTGFTLFKSWVNAIVRKHQKLVVMAGMEPTGITGSIWVNT